MIIVIIMVTRFTDYLQHHEVPACWGAGFWTGWSSVSLWSPSSLAYLSYTCIVIEQSIKSSICINFETILAMMIARSFLIWQRQGTVWAASELCWSDLSHSTQDLELVPGGLYHALLRAEARQRAEESLLTPLNQSPGTPEPASPPSGQHHDQHHDTPPGRPRTCLWGSSSWRRAQAQGRRLTDEPEFGYDIWIKHMCQDIMSVLIWWVIIRQHHQKWLISMLLRESPKSPAWLDSDARWNKYFTKILKVI